MDDEWEDNLESTMRSIAKALWAINDKIPDKEHMVECFQYIEGVEEALHQISFVLDESAILNDWSPDDER
jgi:hypothetical protein